MNKHSTNPAGGAPKASRAEPELLSIRTASGRSVSGLHSKTAAANACSVLAHGAGAGMRHPFLEKVANGLAERGLNTLRYQFPYMEQGSNRPDSPPIAHETVRAAVAKAAEISPGTALFAGGKSFGGRMTSQAQAESPLPGVRGLIFLGFPLHPPGKPSDQRGEHLFKIEIPMLFLQGDRDEFATLSLLRSVVERLGDRATLRLFPDGDHSFHARVRSGRTDAQTMREMLDHIQTWIGSVLS
jgi:predicted alpha/beta-hydrolase family hydrolase